MINLDNFEETFAQSLASLDRYIELQVTESQKFDATHHRRHVEINKDHFRWCLTQGKQLHLCVKCGALEASGYVTEISERLKAEQTCFHCDHWGRIANELNPKRLIIDGHMYSDGGHTPGSKTQFLGFGGHLWTIERDGKQWTTNNLWSGGVIPQEFRDRLSDNARFIK